MTIQRRHLYLFSALFLFWIALCGNLSLNLIALGLFSSCCSVLLYEMLLKATNIKAFPPMRNVRWLTYLGLIARSMFLKTLQSFKRLNTPSEAVVYLSYELTVKHPVSRLLIANAITLSPGMITVDIERDLLKMICFSPKSSEERKSLYLYLDALQDVFREVPSK